MADKMAASGIDYRTVENVYKSERRDGIKELLQGTGDNSNNKLHSNSGHSDTSGAIGGVTKQSKVIDSLTEYFQNILELDWNEIGKIYILK